MWCSGRKKTSLSSGSSKRCAVTKVKPSLILHVLKDFHVLKSNNDQQFRIEKHEIRFRVFFGFFYFFWNISEKL